MGGCALLQPGALLYVGVCAAYRGSRGIIHDEGHECRGGAGGERVLLACVYTATYQDRLLILSDGFTNMPLRQKRHCCFCLQGGDGSR